MEELSALLVSGNVPVKQEADDEATPAETPQMKIAVEAELTADPKIVIEDFTKALNLIIEQDAEEPLLIGEDTEEKDFAVVSQEMVEGLDALPLPVIVITLAEKLAEIKPEEKEIIAPMILEISTIARELNGLDKLDTQAVQTIKECLEEQCVMLFETLEIEYDEQDIEQFINLLINPAFIKLQAQRSMIKPDLEHDGTREAKYSFTSLSGMIRDEEQRLKQLLGMFTLYYASLIRKVPDSLVAIS